MGNCSDCKTFISKTELALGFSDSHDEIFSQNQRSYIGKDYSCFIPIVDKLIGLWRGYTVRKLFTHIYKQSKPEYDYFNITEIQETLSTKIGLAGFKENRDTYKTKTGKYTGQWCGGFKHGYGIMEWSDGCRYEGHWNLSRPSGSGKFIYKNGEGYSGDWKVYFIFNKSLFRTGKLEQWKDCVQDGYCNS